MKKPVMHSIWLVLVLSVLSSSVRGGQIDDLSYEIVDGQVAIIDCDESAKGDLAIPSQIEGLPVTSIGESAFKRVVFLGEGALPVSGSLTSITIPDSVTSIGDWAFGECSSLTSIIIPDSVISIGKKAFLGCDSLTSIIIPDSVTRIGDKAFLGCQKLTSIGLPEKFQSHEEVVRIDAVNAFSADFYDLLSYRTIDAQIHIYHCDRDARGVVIPNEIDGFPVTSISGDAFSNCSSLTSITVDSRNELYKSVDGVVFSKDASQLLICPRGKSGGYTVPDSATSIGGDAFAYCERLTSITISESVTSIGLSAFCFCKKLTVITIPDSVTSIGDYAFMGCSSLTSVTIPDGVTSIGLIAFSGCESLTSIEIPDSVTSIGQLAFSGCSGLTSITMAENVTSIGNGAFSACESLTSISIPQAFHSEAEASRLGLDKLWPDDFSLPDGAGN